MTPICIRQITLFGFCGGRVGGNRIQEPLPLSCYKDDNRYEENDRDNSDYDSDIGEDMRDHSFAVETW